MPIYPPHGLVKRRRPLVAAGINAGAFVVRCLIMTQVRASQAGMWAAMTRYSERDFMAGGRPVLSCQTGDGDGIGASPRLRCCGDLRLTRSAAVVWAVSAAGWSRV